jgi:hypothetical protein
LIRQRSNERIWSNCVLEVKLPSDFQEQLELELWLDPVALHTFWDRTWNQKHLLGTKIEIEGTYSPALTPTTLQPRE